MKSYKISVKAGDLQRALDPSVWPLRVKVREFIYYSRKPGTGRPGQGQGQGQGQQQGHLHQGQAQVRLGQGQPAQSEQPVQNLTGERGSPGRFVAPNRYALPGENVPGGPRPEVKRLSLL